MPINKYFGGHGEEVMADMQKKHGAKKGKSVFYATANKRGQNPGDEHGSLEDMSIMERPAECDVVDDSFVHPMHKGYGKGGDSAGFESKGSITWGALDPPEMDGESVMQFTKGSQSCNRDAGQSIHYGAPVDYFGPDSDFRAEELDPYQFGRDWEPIPLRDYFKTEDDQFERGFRAREQDDYDETPTPGVVTDKQPMSEAYGSANFGLIDKKAEMRDYRSFENQRMFARSNKPKKMEYAVDVSGLDTKKGKKAR